ncbi:hypothetical protein FHW58_002992 [Duganella sp. 1224]|uniref:contractile injection system protein, VgrG/Pvc8 family n=1 Tax=Duganella sp. 1224 TaxID=2587052 RepID=UPI00185BEB55|nr:contractile injection system protein, VgrG/Pvc8 family [Duganella sp. 1224]NYE61785.1 hypothetical protein [Duganella sp. 1224]
MESDSDFFGFMALAKELITDNRPLRLRLALPGGVNDDMLLPQRVFGSESICGGIEYRVLCVSANAHLPLKQMIAVPAVLQFVTDRGDLRNVCGIVTEASSGDSDGGLASYQLVLRDALAILEKRTNTRVFRNMDEVDIVLRILNEWRQKNPVLGTCFNTRRMAYTENDKLLAILYVSNASLGLVLSLAGYFSLAIFWPLFVAALLLAIVIFVLKKSALTKWLSHCFFRPITANPATRIWKKS